MSAHHLSILQHSLCLTVNIHVTEQGVANGNLVGVASVFEPIRWWVQLRTLRDALRARSPIEEVADVVVVLRDDLGEVESLRVGHHGHMSKRVKVRCVVDWKRVVG